MNNLFMLNDIYYYMTYKDHPKKDHGFIYIFKFGINCNY